MNRENWEEILLRITSIGKRFFSTLRKLRFFTELPGAPTRLALSNHQARSVVLQFLPGDSGKTTILKWVVEAQVGSSAAWQRIYEKKAPNARSLLVDKLRPFTIYALRMFAVNIVGRSNYSAPTSKFQTIQDVPSVAPGNVTVRAVNETAIRVRWTVREKVSALLARQLPNYERLVRCDRIYFCDSKAFILTPFLVTKKGEKKIYFQRVFHYRIVFIKAIYEILSNNEKM